jgi:ORF6N domain/LysR substrate binding domain
VQATLDHAVIARDPFVLAAAGHPLARRHPAASPAVLSGVSVLPLDDGHCFRDQALRLCTERGARARAARAGRRHDPRGNRPAASDGNCTGSAPRLSAGPCRRWTICRGGGPMARTAMVHVRRIDHAIVVVRGFRVMLDVDLAALYGVSTRALVQAVKRNKERFPGDFVLKLTADEVEILRSQSVISKSAHGGRRSAPYAFTEQGVAMLSSVLRSRRAVRANIEIMRAFVRLRQMLRPTAALMRKIGEMERKYDSQFSVVFEAIRDLMRPSAASRRRIGFRA